MTQEWVHIGRVRSVNPGRREVRIAPAPECGQAVAALTWLHLSLRDGERMRCRVERMRGGDAPVATLAAGVPRDHVARMKGAAVLSERAVVEAIASQQQRRQPAITPGMRVVGPGGAEIGVITDMYKTGANEACVIKKADGGVMLLPLIEQVVAHVDPGAAVMEVNDVAPFAVEEQAARGGIRRAERNGDHED